MWQADESAEAPGRLENLKELIAAIAEFETLPGFLEHVSLVMENAEGAPGDMVSLMTLARRQGAGVRHRLPAGLGGGAVPAPARARGEWRRRRSRRSAASPMSA